MAAQLSPPNIVFVMADDHAAKAISAYGEGINHTPNIDRLAAEGMKFNHCYVTNRCVSSCLLSSPDSWSSHNHWRSASVNGQKHYENTIAHSSQYLHTFESNDPDWQAFTALSKSLTYV